MLLYWNASKFTLIAMKRIFSCICVFFLACVFALSAIAADEFAFVPKLSGKIERQIGMFKNQETVLYDYHIHLRGGMTAEKAAIRQEKTGIRSGVLENFGRDWPLADNEKLRAFIEEAQKVRADAEPLLIGIQVNDRDWARKIDPKLFEKLDYILADTMIMDTGPDGKPAKMWLDGYTIDDPEKWMERYMNHNRQILGEPISILANPTYLPKPVEHLYDQLWTEERMREIIETAVEKNIAIEIQATSKFPNLKFLKLAKELGAKFSFGTNNFDDTPLPVDRWFEMINELKLEKKDLWEITNEK